MAPSTGSPRTANRRHASPAAKTLATWHSLIAGAKPHFLKTRSLHNGLLRPYKRLLADIVCSEATLEGTLDAANRLFLALEANGHRVTFAPPDREHRRASFDVHKTSDRHEQYPPAWHPDRITAAYVAGVPLGLTLFETTEEVEVMYVHGSYVPVSELSPTQLKRYQGPMHWTKKERRASGHLSLQAYCPHRLADWKLQWHAESAAALSAMVPAIVREIDAAAPELERHLAEAKERAEAQRREWDEQSRRWREQAQREREEKARRQAQTELLEAIKAWDQAQRLQRWLSEVADAANQCPTELRVQVHERLVHARALVGDADPLAVLMRWKSPHERLESPGYF